MQPVAVSTHYGPRVSLHLKITKDEVPCFISLLCSVCDFFFLFASRNTAKQPKQGSSVSDRIVGHSTGQIKHTDLKELSAPQNKLGCTAGLGNFFFQTHWTG